mmetsp:Transcript_14714/g.14568  ORF Transcript_14714/g.14568 Transcript_14714/m.14568 type:complete len:128 (-) Transcript_14714:1188-1571(-)
MHYYYYFGYFPGKTLHRMLHATIHICRDHDGNNKGANGKSSSAESLRFPNKSDFIGKVNPVFLFAITALVDPTQKRLLPRGLASLTRSERPPYFLPSSAAIAILAACADKVTNAYLWWKEQSLKVPY